MPIPSIVSLKICETVANWSSVIKLNLIMVYATGDESYLYAGIMIKIFLPSSAEAQAQLGLSWLYSLLNQAPHPPAWESFFSAPAN